MLPLVLPEPIAVSSLRFHLSPPHCSSCMRRLALEIDIALCTSPQALLVQQRPAVSNRQDRCVAECFVPGRRLNSTGTPRRSHCLSHILAYPWEPRGITATTQLPAHRRGPLHILKPDDPSIQQLVDELLLEIALRAAESAVESPVQLPARASSHAADRHPARTHTTHYTLRGKGGLQTHVLADCLRLDYCPQISTRNDEGVDGLPCSRPRARACRPIWSSRTEPWPVRSHGPLSAVVCAAATHARPGPRSRGL